MFTAMFKSLILVTYVGYIAHIAHVPTCKQVPQSESSGKLRILFV